MQTSTQLAYVLHTRPYRENQRLVEFITEQGKLSALSFVGHGSKSSRKALLQPFLPLQITYKGRNSLKHITAVEPAGKSLLLKQTALYSGFYINELLVKLLTEAVACPELFNHYQTTLSLLLENQSIEVALRKFELVLLDELGISFDFTPVFEDSANSFYFLPEQGFIPAYQASKRNCFAREQLIAIAKEDYSKPDTLLAFKVLMREVINSLLGGIPLNSRKLFAKKRS